MKESVLHKKITDKIKEYFPTIIFNTDSSGIKLNAGQAMLLKELRSDNGFTDITIYETGKLGSVLFMEVKVETPYKLNGELKKNKTFEEQDLMHQALRKRGYHAQFVWSLEMALSLIKKHLPYLKVYE
jgi:hypothetical protein|tara:strand:+ start:905 stop:1288 length:384 start_codon:yes stop_codon:yes gene_type:complete